VVSFFEEAATRTGLTGLIEGAGDIVEDAGVFDLFERNALVFPELILNQLGLDFGDNQPSEIEKASQNVLLGQNATLPIVYGTTTVPGTRVYSEVTGSNDQFLHVIYTFSEGEIGAFNTTYIDGIDITDGFYSGLITSTTHTGSDSQAADVGLIAESAGLWTTFHKLSGVAYIYLKLEYDAKKFKGFPNVSANIDGMELYDVDLDDGTRTFSTNAAEAIYDWMIIRPGRSWNTYGLRIPKARVNIASFQSFKTYCDELITLETGGSTKKRYQFNGLINPKDSQLAVLRQMLDHVKADIIRIDDEFHIVPRQQKASIYSFTQDDLFGDLKLANTGKRGKLNTLKTTFPRTYEYTDSASVDHTITQPTTQYFQDSEFFVLDGSENLEKAIELPLYSEQNATDTDANLYARQYTVTTLRESRRSMGISFVTDLRPINLVPGDVFDMSHTGRGWTNKEFRVTSIEFGNTGLMGFTAQEYTDTDYSDTDTPPVTYPSSVNLPTQTVVGEPQNLAVDNDTTPEYDPRGGTTVYLLDITWTAAPDPNVQYYEVEVKNVTDSGPYLPWDTVTVTGAASYRSVFKSNLRGRYFDVRVRSVTISSYRSDWVEVTNTLLNPIQDPLQSMPLVTGLEVVGANGIGQGHDTTFVGTDIRLQWNHVGLATEEDYEFLTEPEAIGAGNSWLDDSFKNYELIIFHDGVQKDFEAVTGNSFRYTLDANTTDGAGTPSRNVTFEVRAEGKDGQKSQYPASITVSNALPDLLESASITNIRYSTVTFSSTNPIANTDIKDVRIWIDTSASFTISDNKLVYSGQWEPEIIIPNLIANKTYYLKYSPVDTFGIDDTNISSEISFTTLQNIDPNGEAILGTSNIQYDLNNQYMWIGDATFGNTGIQLQYNSGTPRAYIGDGAEKFWKFDGSDMSIGRDSQLLGADAYNNDTLYMHEFFNGSSNWLLTGLSIIEAGNIEVTANTGTTLSSAVRELGVSTLLHPISYSKNFRWKFKLRRAATPDSTTVMKIYFDGFSNTGIGGAGAKYFGLQIDNTTIYGVTNDGTTETKTDTGETMGSSAKLVELVFTAGTSLKIYMDDSLVLTITTNIPTGNLWTSPSPPAGKDLEYRLMSFQVVKTAVGSGGFGMGEFILITEP
jgi:hypothetical protein